MFCDVVRLTNRVVGSSQDDGRPRARVRTSYQVTGMFPPHWAHNHGFALLTVCFSIYIAPSSINSSLPTCIHTLQHYQFSSTPILRPIPPWLTPPNIRRYVWSPPDTMHSFGRDPFPVFGFFFSNELPGLQSSGSNSEKVINFQCLYQRHSFQCHNSSSKFHSKFKSLG